MDATVAAGWIGGLAGLGGAIVGAGGALLGGWLQHRQQERTAKRERQETYARAAGEKTLHHLLELHRSIGGTLQQWDVAADNSQWRTCSNEHIREIEMSSYMIASEELRSRLQEVIILVLWSPPDTEPLDQVARVIGVSNEAILMVAAYLRDEPLPPRSVAFTRAWSAMPARDIAPIPDATGT